MRDDRGGVVFIFFPGELLPADHCTELVREKRVPGWGFVGGLSSFPVLFLVWESGKKGGRESFSGKSWAGRGQVEEGENFF